MVPHRSPSPARPGARQGLRRPAGRGRGRGPPAPTARLRPPLPHPPAHGRGAAWRHAVGGGTDPGVWGPWGGPGGPPDPPSAPPQVVKVVGSNISHKLRLSRVKPEDEGTYECRVIDSSDGKARHHKVKAYLRVEAAGDVGHPQDTQLRGAPLPDPAAPGSAHAHHHHHHHKAGKELKKRSADASCVL